jgi:hypothetical protein
MSGDFPTICGIDVLGSSVSMGASLVDEGFRGCCEPVFPWGRLASHEKLFTDEAKPTGQQEVVCVHPNSCRNMLFVRNP